MKLIKKRYIILFTFLLMIILIAIFGTSQDLQIRHYSESTKKVSETIKIAVITDLHNTTYGEHQAELISATKEQNPDFICFVGDLINSIKHIDEAIDLISSLTKSYPCYYVSGNHEYWSENCDNFKGLLRSYGVNVLEGTKKSIKVRGQNLQICGVDDPEVLYEPMKGYKGWNEQLERCNKETGEVYSILLSHRPEKVEDYNKCNFDLILCGHAHGGQFRIPWLMNGLYAPDQGFFPKFAGGEYKLSDSMMIVSRGLIKNHIPRVFNRPELVIVDICPDE
ncbi:MAG: putative protein YpbG [Eubacteriales bacterium SKADARSKE-1]|nr:putative protein YpbG [Eubacteriales bacterium SKADARSKE-1]